MRSMRRSLRASSAEMCRSTRASARYRRRSRTVARRARVHPGGFLDVVCPKRAMGGVFRRQPAVRLSQQGREWLNERLQAAFETHGKIPRSTLRDLDWPEIA